MAEKLFPIQADHGGYGIPDKPKSHIPWWLAEVAYEFYASRYGTQQSIERLAERGGFGRDELLELLRRGNFNGKYDLPAPTPPTATAAEE